MNKKTKKKKNNNTIKTKKQKINKTKKIFNDDNYNSSNGMLTAVWGPSLWHYLHTMSFNYPINPTTKDIKHYKSFIINLKNILPCKYCRINLTKNLKLNPLTNECMKNRASFSKYIYNLHEIINKNLGKKSNLTYEQIKDRYENFRASCNVDNKIFKFQKETGCTNPLYGKKAKCIIKIVPQDMKCKTMQIDKTCVKSRSKIM